MSGAVISRGGGAEWRKGYPVVATSFLGVGVAVIASWSMGLFIEPIQREFGWGRGEISAALLVLSTVSFFAAPFVGRLIDTAGTRRVGIVGMIVYSIGLALIGCSGTERWQWWAIWIVVAIGYVLVKPTLWAVAVSKRFDVQRGLALAITMCGSGVILIIMPTIVTRLIAEFGWRTSYIVLGAGTAVLTLPLILAFLRDEDRRPDGARPTVTAEAERAAGNAELWSSLRSGRFLRLAIGTIVMTIATIGLQVHFVPLVTQKGMSLSTAAYVAGMIGVGSIMGRLICGFLMDRWRGQIVGAIFFALPALSSLCLLNYGGGTLVACAIAFVQGLALGAEMDVISYLTSRYFGLRNYGTLVGTIMGGVGLANGLGPTLAGFIYDLTGSYDLFLIMTVPAFLISAILVYSLGDYRLREPKFAP
ncbi:MFS transporter [Rhizorhabdus dicambivorans]|uniref:MFS transporter n=1 Tax=Rhizorhabdus dicambivorans TaxID=1850238 RepID=A0A2A4FZE9_9SPHN|nr:MFS transporter [Rhizorhabdus dicambivorans]ATE65986.1 MFS transporter [Rhizorhabdus dicambivorans]PCE43102.1 MFS transporter [Rhizorhabdus dicambivorans]